MPARDLGATMLAAWRTNNRVTMELVQLLPAALWDTPVPGVPRRTVRMIAAHIHNARCSWVKTLGREHGIPTPKRVDHRRVTRRQLVAALKRSGKGIEAVGDLGRRRVADGLQLANQTVYAVGADVLISGDLSTRLRIPGAHTPE